MIFALAGNPNSGKTTLFNRLTGSNQYVGNWPGVTVEKKEGMLVRDGREIKIVDLPGIYSLSPYSLEEKIARNYLLSGQVDAIINIVDGSNLERNLYLSTQILEMGLPVVIAVNMMDIVESSGKKIDFEQLSRHAGVPVLPISAFKGEGLDNLISSAFTSASEHRLPAEQAVFASEIEEALENIRSHAASSGSGISVRERFYRIKILERDSAVFERYLFSSEDRAYYDKISSGTEEKFGDSVESIVSTQRYSHINKIIKAVVKEKTGDGISLSDRLDMVLTRPAVAVPFFFVLMIFVYYISVGTLGAWLQDGLGYFFDTLLYNKAADFLNGAGASPWAVSMVTDGVITGVGTVLSFLPQIFLIFMFLAIFEDSGYIARISFVVDKYFRRVGLSGRSFVPMLVGAGCSVPGIMAARLVKGRRERILTIMLTPFISCGAKIPVYVLFAGVFFPDYSFIIVASLYLLGIVSAFLSAFILRKTVYRGQVSPFIMEMPAYRIPGLRNVLRRMWDRGWDLITKAGTIIFVGSVIIWLLQAFDLSFTLTDDVSESILASAGSLIAPFFAPLGFGTWEASVAVLTGIVAKEAVAATVGVLAVSAGTGLEAMFTPAAALSFMVFILLAAPCMAAIAAMKMELHNWRTTLFALAYQTGFAWVMSFVIYRAALVFGL